MSFGLFMLWVFCLAILGIFVAFVVAVFRAARSRGSADRSPNVTGT